MTFFNTALVAGAAVAVLGLTAAQAGTITFNETQLAGGTVNTGMTQVDVESGGLGLTASTDPTEDGRVRTYRVGTPQGGLWFGATEGLNFGSSINNATAPEDAIYKLTFDRAITSISLSFDFLTDTASRPQPEFLSEFMNEDGAAVITATNLARVTFDETAQTIVADRLAPGGGAGSGTLSFDNGGQAFTMFSFRHQQTAQQIGFTVNTVTVNVSAVPLPAGGVLLVTGLLGLSHLRRRKTRSAA